MADYINGYALALLDLAKEEKKLITYKNDSLMVIKAIESNKDIVAILNSKSTNKETRDILVKEAFRKVQKNILNFLFILTERSKFNLAVSVLKKLVKLINGHENINEGIVYSVGKLTSKQIKDIEVKTSKMIGMKVVLANKLDAEMISGVRVQVGDEVIEDTIASRLEQIRNQLLEGGEN